MQSAHLQYSIASCQDLQCSIQVGTGHLGFCRLWKAGKTSHLWPVDQKWACSIWLTVVDPTSVLVGFQRQQFPMETKHNIMSCKNHNWSDEIENNSWGESAEGLDERCRNHGMLKDAVSHTPTDLRGLSIRYCLHRLLTYVHSPSLCTKCGFPSQPCLRPC